MTKIITGLHEIAPGHDALVCDVWGVLHNGHKAFAPACAALKTFKEKFGPAWEARYLAAPGGMTEPAICKHG